MRGSLKRFLGTFEDLGARSVPPLALPCPPSSFRMIIGFHLSRADDETTVRLVDAHTRLLQQLDQVGQMPPNLEYLLRHSIHSELGLLLQLRHFCPRAKISRLEILRKNDFFVLLRGRKNPPSILHDLYLSIDLASWRLFSSVMHAFVFYTREVMTSNITPYLSYVMFRQSFSTGNTADYRRSDIRVGADFYGYTGESLLRNIKRDL